MSINRRNHISYLDYKIFNIKHFLNPCLSFYARGVMAFLEAEFPAAEKPLMFRDREDLCKFIGNRNGLFSSESLLPIKSVIQELIEHEYLAEIDELLELQKGEIL